MYRHLLVEHNGPLTGVNSGYAVGVHMVVWASIPDHGPLGAFSNSAGTAPIITLFTPGTPLKTTPLQKRA